MRMQPTMLLATLLAVGLLPITSQAQQQREDRPTPRQTIRDSVPSNTREQAPEVRRSNQATTIQQRSQTNQLPGTTTQRSDQVRTTQGQQGVDEQLSLFAAAEMAIMNECEIKTAKLASEKIDNEQIQQFAQTMIRDHQQLNQQLMQAMPELQGLVKQHSSDRTSSATQSTQSTQSRTVQSTQQGVQNGLSDSPARQATETQRSGTIQNQQAQSDDPSDRRTVQSPQQSTQQQTIRPEGSEDSQLSPGATERATGYRGTDQLSGQSSGSMTALQQKMIHICQEAANNSFKMTEQEFSEKQGKDLEMCYMGSQLVVHQQMVANLQALQGEGTQEFQQIVQQAEETAQQHLAQAKSIVETLAQQSESGQQQSRSPNSSNQGSTQNN